MTPFTDAPTIANPAASSLQSAATAAASSTPAASIQSTIQNYFQSAVTSLTTRLQTISNPFVGSNASINRAVQEIWFLLTGQTVVPTNLGTMFDNGISPFASVFYSTEGLPYFSVGMGNFGTQIAKSAGWLGGPSPAAAAAAQKISRTRTGWCRRPGGGGIG